MFVSGLLTKQTPLFIVKNPEVPEALTHLLLTILIRINVLYIIYRPSPHTIFLHIKKESK
ncbi:hypothetical protein nublan006_31440 [Klebsiella pneumoniae]|nr:hypothetical protein NUBL21973_39180 [Klebsiella pneumoniae]GKM43486.1 hypothetical protein NUBL13939_09140 [Klebsiella pneumoniae]GKP17798.1 hypothetical protein NUBL13779_43960 [Klebsiella pneumoniae]GKP32290.1 hypothetical protein NUBL13780_43760 [Klebsiella pneumoniae]CDL19225.1 hypothetical protein [Klebsiella pneumoniae IS53]